MRVCVCVCGSVYECICVCVGSSLYNFIKILSSFRISVVVSGFRTFHWPSTGVFCTCKDTFGCQYCGEMLDHLF